VAGGTGVATASAGVGGGVKVGVTVGVAGGANRPSVCTATCSMIATPIRPVAPAVIQKAHVNTLVLRSMISTLALYDSMIESMTASLVSLGLRRR
jgi:hypothetical protein